MRTSTVDVSRSTVYSIGKSPFPQSHVEHIDEANGWFRFTMTTTHPVFGEIFFQTGRFHALGG